MAQAEAIHANARLVAAQAVSNRSREIDRLDGDFQADFSTMSEFRERYPEVYKHMEDSIMMGFINRSEARRKRMAQLIKGTYQG